MDMHDAGRSTKTIGHTLQVMRGVLDLAKRHGHLNTLPDFPALKDRRPKRIAYRFEESVRALDKAREDSDPLAYLFLLLGFHAGLYQEEIMGLDRTDVDLDLGCLHVRRSALDSGATKPPKTENRVRDIPLTPMLEEALRAHLRTIPVGVPFLFHRREAGAVRRLKKEWIRWPVRSVLDRAGLPLEEPFRRMRRTFCTEAKQRVPEVLVTRWMGHADHNVTDRHYVADLPMDYQRRMIALLEEPAQLSGPVLGASWEPVLVAGGKV
jgi:integrase